MAGFFVKGHTLFFMRCRLYEDCLYEDTLLYLKRIMKTSSSHKTVTCLSKKIATTHCLLVVQTIMPEGMITKKAVFSD